MKDIENSMPQSAASLTRLERALARLDAAVTRKAATSGAGAANAELVRMQRDHAALKETAARVADRLDATITRLGTIVRQGG